ncbi:transcriptional regulator [Fervidicella metallireducens AeB]|uniref:Transcriptional regulator n=1 Tax=Fervidicella metallireducens AeB TaxID=1403537 RepID=A0A017RTN4_9CLOT|nr:metalloregulator ArsR/SmtB family transcription factor [Fervidicella metallireducens]EYE87961.1 transcriptional regulator [Fervidicella metallireducens AeB]
MTQEELSVRVFKALGHPIRYKIVKFLLDEPKCVCKLNENVDFSQSNLSQHLKILKNAGILTSEKIGLNIFYKISSEDIANLLRISDEFVMNLVKKMNENIDNI